MNEFSRRVDVFVFKDVPVSFDLYVPFLEEAGVDDETKQRAYAAYLKNFQPYRWHAEAANNEVIAQGESYFNLADCINAIEINYGDDTTAYRMPQFGEDRGMKLLRYGKSDRNAQAAQQ